MAQDINRRESILIFFFVYRDILLKFLVAYDHTKLKLYTCHIVARVILDIASN